MTTTNKILFAAFALTFTTLVCVPMTLAVAVGHGVMFFIGLWSIVISDVRKVWRGKVESPQEQGSVWDRHIKKLEEKQNKG